MDSNVFWRRKKSTTTQRCSFQNSLDLDSWSFENDPCVEDKEGSFLEIPIASVKLNPLFYWKFAFLKKMKLNKHKSFGDGFASPTSNSQLKRLLTKSSYSVVSMDGYKCSLLDKAFKSYLNDNKQNFVIIGHPKAFTKYSLAKLDKFMASKLIEKNAVKTFGSVI